ncbi:MAG: MBL fold metallo-hydrolase [Pseudomonadota bacterium]
MQQRGFASSPSAAFAGRGRAGLSFVLTLTLTLALATSAGCSARSTSGSPANDAAPPGTTFDIYWIDVEGGGATLLVAPSGQTMLVDGGFPGNNDRDVNRVLKVIDEQVHATKLDYVVTTHYHGDHVGGVTALASRFPVGQFMDHGPSVEGGSTYNNYVAAIAGKTRVVVKPGDRLQMGALDVLFVASAGELIDPLPTAIANPHCAGAAQMAERPTDENPLSVGLLARFGSFDFLDLGDMTWAVEDRLACPTNRIGPVDLLQVSHHGLDLSSAPQLVHSLAPLVAVMNNGATKGGAPASFDTFKSAPGLLDLWALHRAVNNDAAHNAADALIANISTAPDGAYFVKAAVSSDGSFAVTNARTGETRAYRAR